MNSHSQHPGHPGNDTQGRMSAHAAGTFMVGQIEARGESPLINDILNFHATS
jgi:hypothetical protein